MAQPTLKQTQDAIAWLEAAYDRGDYRSIPLPTYDVERTALALLGFDAGLIRVANATPTTSDITQLNTARAHWMNHLHYGQTLTIPSQQYFDALYCDIQNALHNGAMKFEGYTTRQNLGWQTLTAGTNAVPLTKDQYVKLSIWFDKGPIDTIKSWYMSIVGGQTPTYWSEYHGVIAPSSVRLGGAQWGTAFLPSAWLNALNAYLVTKGVSGIVPIHGNPYLNTGGSSVVTPGTTPFQANPITTPTGGTGPGSTPPSVAPPPPPGGSVPGSGLSTSSKVGIAAAAVAAGIAYMKMKK